MDHLTTTRSIAASSLRAMVAAVLLVLTTFSSWAQTSPPADPIIGTWKLNPALTKTSPGMPIPPPSERTETYRLDAAGQIELTVATPSRNGSTTSSQLVFSARGGVVTRKGAAAGQMLIETRVGPGDWLVTYLANGVQFLTMRKTVSSDGKSMRQIVTGVTPQGASFEGLLVFDRQ
jgi:hypothetical protein